MNILSWIKGKIKQKEVSNYKKDENFSFEEDYYGDTNILDGFKILYCNNYNKISNNTPEDISFISLIISIPYNDKSLSDIMTFTSYIVNHINKFDINYDIINIKFNYTDENNKKILLFLRGNISLYKFICNNLYNNIITKYIRNNLFPNDSFINCPIEFENNIINSIDCPSKDIDLLFIEDNISCKDFKPVIGISISKSNFIDKDCPIYYDDISYTLNDRIIIITSIDKLSEDELNYIINNVPEGNKLITFIHQNIDNDINIDLDIDEII